MQSSQAIAGVQRAVKDLLVWQATVVQHNQTYEIMHLAWVFFFKWENEIGSLFLNDLLTIAWLQDEKSKHLKSRN